MTILSVVDREVSRSSYLPKMSQNLLKNRQHGGSSSSSLSKFSLVSPYEVFPPCLPWTVPEEGYTPTSSETP